MTKIKPVLATPRPSRKQTNVINARPAIPNRNWTAKTDNRGFRLRKIWMPSISQTVLTRASPHNRDVADIIWPAAVDPFRARGEQISQNLLALLLMRAAAN